MTCFSRAVHFRIFVWTILAAVSIGSSLGQGDPFDAFEKTPDGRLMSIYFLTIAQESYTPARKPWGELSVNFQRDSHIACSDSAVRGKTKLARESNGLHKESSRICGSDHV